MAEQEWDFDDETDEQPTGKDLRSQLKKVLNENKKLQTEVQGFRQQDQISKASSLLSEKGYDPAAAKYAQKDGVDLSDVRQVETWLEENGKFFKAGDSATQGTDNPVDEPATELAAEAQNSWGRILRSQQNASPAALTKFEQVMKNLPEDATSAQVHEAFSKTGVI